MTKPIDGPIIIQDDIAFIRSTFMMYFMDLKQGRGGDKHIECEPKAFYEIYNMWARAAYENMITPNKRLKYLSGGVPIEYLSIIYTDSDTEHQISLSIEKIEL